MAQAYAFLVDDAPYPIEMEFAHAVKSLGVKAVTGRDMLSAREIRDYEMAEYAGEIIRLYRARETAPSLAEWVQANPRQHEMLEKAREIWQIQSK